MNIMPQVVDKKMYHSLSSWYTAYCNGLVGPYSVTLQHSIYTEEEDFYVALKIDMDQTACTGFNFNVKLQVMGCDKWSGYFITEGQRKFRFNYDPDTQQISWIMPDGENSTLMFPPPLSKFVKTESSPGPDYSFYTDGTQVRHCDIPYSFERYQVRISLADLNRFLA